jgi:outer membrane protein
MRYLVLPMVLCMMAGVSAAQESQPISLAEAVRIATERHEDVAKARAATDGLKGKIREVRAQALPDISIVSNANRLRDPGLLNSSSLDKFPEELRNALSPIPSNLFDYSISVKQPLYTQGKVGTALRLASVEMEGSVSEVDRAQQDVALSTVKAYFGLLWAERYRDLVAETQSQKKAHAEMARVRYQNGVATEVDALRSEVAVANGAPDLTRAENAIRQSRALLNYYLGRPLDSATKLSGDFEQKDWGQTNISDMEQEALRRRPEIQRLRIAERSAATQLELAKAESRMRADFSGQYGVASRLLSNLGSSKFIRWSMGVNFTLPVFDGFKRSGLITQAVANQRAARLEREKQEQQIRLSIQQGFDDLKAAAETLDAARANVGQAEKVLQMTQSNYKYGAATTLDVMDAQTAVSSARSNVLRGLYDFSLARANLRWAMGSTPWE